jgi:valyl-tRNA synthetase
LELFASADDPADDRSELMTTPDAAETQPGANEMATAYEPGLVEHRIYEQWESSGAFRPSNPGARPFTLIMPPPNLTGELHVGHGLVVSVEDALIRWHRMLGDDTLWLPGVDHAAIAVNAIIERQLREEGLSRHDVGREEFLRRVWEFVNASRERIMEQHKRLGASADWEREAFTMDEARQASVRATFKRLYDDGLIYRGERIINWDPVSQTAVSDLEVEYEEVESAFWHVRYPVLDDDGEPTDKYVVIATTRPETIPADTAVAVNPEDDRYRDLVGREVLVPMVNRPVAVIADEAVDIEGGSGALKVTPGHDPVDFEIGERHDLEIINILNLDGTLNEAAGPYAGMDRDTARQRIVADLEAAGLMEKIEPHTHPVGHSERSGAIVEPLVSLQWWVDIKPLATPAIAAVKDGRIKFVPERFDRTYLHWMENIRDWCISRQIWWGHRIPAWYCESCDEVTVAVEDATQCEHCGSTEIRQDEDTLDTWFSSGLWPHSTLGWPDDDAEDLKRFYPTQVMETAYDIIFFWVARMIMMSLYNMKGEVPFETVYLHGLVRAPDGRKMSKSLGNVVDPLGSIEQYGTDALRFALLSGTSPGNDQRISDERLEAGRNFANKLWNASRFALGMVEAGEAVPALKVGDLPSLPVADQWIVTRANATARNVERLLGQFELAEALRQTRDFFWDDFADWYIEFAKVRVREGDRRPVPVLIHVMDRVLRLLHPFMPFVTEEIWQKVRAVRPDLVAEDQLITAGYPGYVEDLDQGWTEMQIDAVRDVVRAVRNVRAEKQVDAGQWVEVYVSTDGRDDLRGVFEEMRAEMELLARVRPLHVVDSVSDAPTEQVVREVLNSAQVIVPMSGLFDSEVERERLQKQIAEVERHAGSLEGKLGNEQFTSRAPAEVVQRERDSLETAQARLEGLRQSLAELG